MATSGKSGKATAKWKQKIVNSHFKTRQLINVNGKRKAKVIRKTKINWNAVEDGAECADSHSSTSRPNDASATTSNLPLPTGPTATFSAHETGNQLPLDLHIQPEFEMIPDCEESSLSGW